MNALITQVHPLVHIRRTRKLDGSGTVMVRVGQKVSPSDVIAECTIPTQHILIDVFRTLGVNSAAAAEKIIDRKVGDQLEKHDIIAETGGLFSKVIRTPAPAKIVAINNGQVLLETNSRKKTIQSGFSGTIVEIIKDRGAVIETDGMLAQGVWGNDQIGSGSLMVDSDLIDKELTPESVSLTFRGAIIAAAFCTNKESLIAAGSLPVSGLILGSMSPELLDIAKQQPYPIILMEGFGRNGINPFVKKLLLTNSKREISILAERWDRTKGIRPEIVISLPADGEIYRETAEFAQGQYVRDHAAPFSGRIGTIENIPTGLVTLSNGIRTSAAAVKFPKKESVLVPFSNLDIIDLENRFLGITE